MSGKSSTKVSVLNLISDILDVAHGALLLRSSSSGGLGSVLALGIGASGLPARDLLGSRLSRSRGSSRGGSGRGSSGSSSGSSRCGSAALAGGRGSGGLGQRDNGSGSSSRSSTASPGHGLRRTCRLGSRSLDLGRGRGRLLGLFFYLNLLFGNLLSSSLGGRGSRRLDLGLGLGVLAIGAGLLSDLRDKLLLDRGGLDNRFGSGLGDLGGRGSGLLLSLVSFRVIFLVDVSQHVVENKVSGGLLGEDESLDEFSGLGSLVGGLADDLNDNALVGSLGIDVGDADLAVLEVECLDTLLDGLCARRGLVWLLVCGNVILTGKGAYLTANGDIGDLGLLSVNKLRALAVEELCEVG